MQIKYKLVFSLILVSVVINLVIGVVLVRDEYNRENIILRQKIENIANLANILFESSLWNFEKEHLSSSANQLFKDEEIISLKVYDNNGYIQMELKKDIKGYNGETIFERINLVKNDYKFGIIEIVFTKRLLNMRIRQKIKEIILMVTVGLISYIIVIFSLSRLILRPIDHIVSVLRKVDHGDMDSRLKLDTKDEFHDIEFYFNRMITTINSEIKKSYQKEMELKDSEEKYRSLVETTSDWVWEVDSGFVYTYSSPKVKDILGYEVEEIIGITPFDLMKSNDANIFSTLFSEIVQKNKPFDGIEIVIPHKDGHDIIIDTSGVPFFDENGQLLGYKGIDRDITEKRKAEMEVQKFQALLNSANEQSPVGVIIIDARDYTYQMINPQAAELLLINRDIDEPYNEFQITWDTFSPDGKVYEKDNLPIMRTLRGEIVKNENVYIIREDGSERWVMVNGSPIYDDNNEMIAAVIIFLDTTKQRRVDQALRESQEQFEAFMDVLPAGVFMKNEYNELKYSNEFYANNFKDHQLANISSLIIDFESRNSDIINYEQTVLIDGPLKTEEVFEGEDGNPHYYEVVRFIIKRHGKLPYLGGIAIDITERKNRADEIKELNEKLEERVKVRTNELKMANDKLIQSISDLQLTQDQLVQSEKMAALGELVAGVAHEINTPVGVGVTAVSHLSEQFTGITNKFTEGTLKKSELETFFSEGTNLTEVLTVNISKAAELIKGFKQVAVDQTSEEMRKFDIKEYFNEILISIKPQIRNKNITINIDCPDKLVVQSYPGALSQIITNLIFNSITHGFENSHDGEIVIIVTKKKKSVHLSYYDNGKGIPVEYHNKIYEPFFTTKRGSGGSGLGLNIVYNLVTQRLNGTISLDKDRKRGVNFEIIIPVEFIDVDNY